MGTEIKYLISVCLALGASFTGTALFRLGRQQIEQMEGIKGAGSREENEKLPDKKLQIEKPLAEKLPDEKPQIEKTLPEKLLSEKFWQAGMYAADLFVSVFLTAVYGAQPLPVLRVVLLCAVLWACAWTDCKAYLIPNKILLAGLLFFIGLSAVQTMLEPGTARYELTSSAVSAGGLLTAGFLCRLVVPGSVGYGDLKLFVIIGLYLGAGSTWNAVFYTLLASFAASVFLLATKRASRKSVMPFAPFLLFGTLLAAFLNGV